MNETIGNRQGVRKRGKLVPHRSTIFRSALRRSYTWMPPLAETKWNNTATSLLYYLQKFKLLTCIPVLEGLKNASLVVGRSCFGGNSWRTGENDINDHLIYSNDCITFETRTELKLSKALSTAIRKLNLSKLEKENHKLWWSLHTLLQYRKEGCLAPKATPLQWPGSSCADLRQTLYTRSLMDSLKTDSLLTV